MYTTSCVIKHTYKIDHPKWDELQKFLLNMFSNNIYAVHLHETNFPKRCLFSIEMNESSELGKLFSMICPKSKYNHIFLDLYFDGKNWEIYTNDETSKRSENLESVFLSVIDYIYILKKDAIKRLIKDCEKVNSLKWEFSDVPLNNVEDVEHYCI